MGFFRGNQRTAEPFRGKSSFDLLRKNEELRMEISSCWTAHRMEIVSKNV